MTLLTFLLLAIFTIIACAVTVLICTKGSTQYPMKHSHFVLAAFIALFLWAFVIFIFWAFSYTRVNGPVHYDKKYAIYSMEDNFITEGRFALGTGYIQEKTYYYFYVKDQYGYRLARVPTSGYRLIEMTGKLPGMYQIQQSRTAYINDFGRLWFTREEKSYYDEVGGALIVPENTIRKTYRSDMQ